jgi:hypothetical protein
MIDIPAEAIRFNMFYQGLSPISQAEGGVGVQKLVKHVPQVTDETPSFRNIHMKNIFVRGSGVAAVFQGLPEMKLQNVTLENAVLESDGGISIKDADDLMLRKVKLMNKENFAMTIENSSNIVIEGLTLNQINQPPLVKIAGSETDSIRFIDTSINLNDIAISKDVSGDAVQIEHKRKVATASK